MDLDKNLVRKVTSFRPTDFGTGPVPTRDKPKFHLAVLHFWWFLGLSQKSENRVRKVTSFRPTIFGRPVLSRILGCGNPGGGVLSVLDQVRTKFGPWNPEYGPKRDFGKVTSFRPTIFGHPVLSRIVPYSGFQGPNLVRTWSRTLRMILDIQPKFQLGAQWSLVCSPHSQPGCI